MQQELDAQLRPSLRKRLNEYVNRRAAIGAVKRGTSEAIEAQITADLIRSEIPGASRRAPKQPPRPVPAARSAASLCFISCRWRLRFLRSSQRPEASECWASASRAGRQALT